MKSKTTVKRKQISLLNRLSNGVNGALAPGDRAYWCQHPERYKQKLKAVLSKISDFSRPIGKFTYGGEDLVAIDYAWFEKFEKEGIFFDPLAEDIIVNTGEDFFSPKSVTAEPVIFSGEDFGFVDQITIHHLLSEADIHSIDYFQAAEFVYHLIRHCHKKIPRDGLIRMASKELLDKKHHRYFLTLRPCGTSDWIIGVYSASSARSVSVGDLWIANLVR